MRQKPPASIVGAQGGGKRRGASAILSAIAALSSYRGDEPPGRYYVRAFLSRLRFGCHRKRVNSRGWKNCCWT